MVIGNDEMGLASAIIYFSQRGSKRSPHPLCPPSGGGTQAPNYTSCQSS